jgi:hypothetical protein
VRARVQLTGLAALLLGAAAPASAGSAVTAQSSAGTSSLELDGRGTASTHIVKIAELSLSSDASVGLTLTITSGSLAKADGSTPVTFQVVLVNRAAQAPASAAFTTASGTPYLFSTHSAGTVEKDIYIKYAPAARQDPGSYSASVDLDVMDN